MRFSLSLGLKNGSQKMLSFKELFIQKSFNQKLIDASVSLSSLSHQLHLRFDNKDIIIAASYEGKTDPWFSSLCSLVIGKSLNEADLLSLSDWENVFHDDQTFWELKQDSAHEIFNEALELLHATLDTFRGRDYLYKPMSALICRCFGVRESDVLDHLKQEVLATVENLGEKTKAGMGCRTCVPQLERWLSKDQHKSSRYYKDRPMADWLLQIDQTLKLFPKALEWDMQVESFKQGIVIISFNKIVSQKEEEEVGTKLQGFLASGVDAELSFFLRRSRQA